MKRLSIIIPMYNVEPYVERCIRSLEDQDISADQYEIICINDGSPDDSIGVVKKLNKEFDNIILIDQENQGVSRARNNGIDRATGKYMMFIDPDDYVESNKLERVLSLAEKQDIEVCFLGFTFLKIDGSVRNHVTNTFDESIVYPGTEAYLLARGNGRTDPDRMVAVLFSSAFINRYHLRYLQGIPYLEDGEFIARILCLANRCVFDSIPFYQRTTRPGSATNSNLFNSDRAINGFLVAAENLHRFQKSEHLTQDQKKFLNQPIAKFTILAFKSSLNRPFLYSYRSICRKLKSLDLVKLEKNGVVRPYTRFVWFYNNFPVVYLINTCFVSIKNLIKEFIGWSKIRKRLVRLSNSW